MSHPGHPWENSPIERWWNDFKLIWINKHPRPKTLAELEQLVKGAIEYFNTKRAYTSKNGLTAEQFRNQAPKIFIYLICILEDLAYRLPTTYRDANHYATVVFNALLGARHSPNYLLMYAKKKVLLIMQVVILIPSGSCS